MQQGGNNPREPWLLAHPLRGDIGEPIAKPTEYGFALFIQLTRVFLMHQFMLTSEYKQFYLLNI
jgi:hypothetical protein